MPLPCQPNDHDHGTGENPGGREAFLRLRLHLAQSAADVTEQVDLRSLLLGPDCSAPKDLLHHAALDFAERDAGGA